MSPTAHTLPPPSENDPFHTAEAKEILKFLKEVGNPDRKVDWKEKCANEMAGVHALFLDMFSRVYAFANYAVENNDVANYLGYAEIIIYQLWSHHHYEETEYFPEMQKAAGVETLQVNFEQHHVFHIQLEVTWLYIRKVRSNLKAKPPTSVPEPSAEIKTYDIKALSGLDPDLPFDSTAFKSYMATWIPSMVVHLRDEIATLSSELMEKAGKEKLAEIDKKLMNHLMAYDPAWFLCSAFASLPIDVVKRMIPVPYVVRRLFIPFLWGPKYKGFWLYCPYPENLTFSGTA